MNLFSALQDPAATKMRQAVRLFAEALLELAAEPNAEAVPAAAPEGADLRERLQAVAKSAAAAKSERSERLAQRMRALAAERTARTQDLVPRLRELAGTMPASAIAKELGIGKSSVYRLASEHEVDLGVRQIVDDAVMLPKLRELAGTMSVPEICRALGIAKTTAYRLAHEGGFTLGQAKHRHGKIDIEALRQFAATETIPQLMARFGCTDSGLRLAAKGHGIVLQAQHRRGRNAAVNFTPAMDEQLRAAAGRVPSDELAAQLGVTRNPLLARAKSLGLSLTMLWTEERSAELRRLAGTKTMLELATIFRVPFTELKAEADRQEISLAQPRPERAPKPRKVRQVTAVSEAVDAVPSTLTERGWVEGAAEVAPVVEVHQPDAPVEPPVLEGITYSITTPDRSPPSPELIEALQPLVAAAVEAMRPEVPQEPSTVEQVQRALERLDFAPVVQQPSAAFARYAPKAEPAQEVEAEPPQVPAVAPASPSDFDETERSGAALIGYEAPMPVFRTRRRPGGEPRATPVRRADPPSKWVRLQHPDGRWLRMDGLGWVEKKADSFQVLRTKLDNVLKAFPLARECKVISEVAWSPKDILYAETVR